MNTRNLAALVIALAATSPALAADYALVMPTGAVVNCSALDSVRFKDMPRLYGTNNFSKEYEQYLRFRTYAPRDCERADSKALAARDAKQPWRLVAAAAPAK
jgi:hypothetical protein